MDTISESVELAEAHEEWAPQIGVDMLWLTGHLDGLVDVSSNDSHLKRQSAGYFIGPRSERMDGFENSFELNGALGDARRGDKIGRSLSQACNGKLLALVTISHSCLVGWNGIGPS